MLRQYTNFTVSVNQTFQSKRIRKKIEFFYHILAISRLLGSSSDEDEAMSPREKVQKNKDGFSDFCVRRIEQHSYGRREIEIAEQEMPGIMALRNKAKVI